MKPSELKIGDCMAMSPATDTPAVVTRFERYPDGLFVARGTLDYVDMTTGCIIPDAEADNLAASLRILPEYWVTTVKLREGMIHSYDTKISGGDNAY